ncbi:unnamed protein product [Rhizophagus irregularis]|uniref:Uncharacterized protein n=1 Tax=Rhizophagus irregularis TaxID=588596 RepID=A0A915ZB96_9GLOM|nr:unnamed protein product [Rhizophagus irregularis]
MRDFSTFDCNLFGERPLRLSYSEVEVWTLGFVITRVDCIWILGVDSSQYISALIAELITFFDNPNNSAYITLFGYAVKRELHNIDQMENRCLNVPLVIERFSSELIVEHNVMADICCKRVSCSILG